MVEASSPRTSWPARTRDQSFASPRRTFHPDHIVGACGSDGILGAEAGGLGGAEPARTGVWLGRGRGRRSQVCRSVTRLMGACSVTLAYSGVAETLPHHGGQKTVGDGAARHPPCHIHVEGSKA